MEKFFHLKENGTTVSTEIMAGLTTFFAMSYIIIVNPQILSSTGMPWGGVFLATIIAAIIGTLVMGLFANVPYAQAAGMGLNAFFTYTVCFGLGFKWQETLCMVFLCGLINIIITVTKIRKMIIQAIPEVLQNAIAQLPQTFGVIFTKDGFPALFSDVSKLPIILLTIFAFSMSDTFDTIGTFIGTGRRTGIFSAEDEKALENGSGFSSKMDKALFADSIATSIGAICGTSNTTTYVESSAGIAAGGSTGLTSVVVAICFALSAFLSPVISAVPSAATAGVLVVVGCMMASSLKEIEWGDISEAIPAFFASVFMAFSYSISYGIAGGFITYCIVKTCKKQAKDVHPVIWVVAVLFILDFIITAVL